MASAKLICNLNNVDRVGKILTQYKENYSKIGNEIVDSNAKIFYDKLISNIESQSISWKPLNPQYKERKGLLGLDTRVLIATGEYLSSIQIRRVYKGNNKTQRHVGVDSRATHKGGLKMSELAIIMEYGTSDGRIPARSHYSKTWEQVLPEIRKNTLEKARTIRNY